MNGRKDNERLPTYRRFLHVCRMLAMLSLFGGFAVNSFAEYSDRRQIIVFATQASESGKLVQRSVNALRCQLIDRDTDVRFVDITELPDGLNPATGTELNEEGVAVELAQLRSDVNSDFELVLIGKDGGVKARTNDPNALQDFLALIDTMPMRRAEIKSRGGSNGDCK